jgi:hypothetical protein
MKLVPTAVSNKIAHQSLLVGKRAPTLLFVGGVAGMVGSTVLACRATLKMEEIVKKTKDDLASAKSLRMSERADEVQVGRHAHLHEEITETYSEQDYRKDVTIIYSRAVVATVKQYGPAILLGAASIGCLAKSHDILTKRNAALTAAYIAVDDAFTKYRRRVVEKYGEAEDREFRFPTEEIDVIDENGKLSQERRLVSDAPSMYARFFDEYSNQWSKEPDYNFVFLACQQRWANNALIARGHLFLNEVYDALGLERTTAGSVVGWVVSHDGDNYVDFGIFTDKDARQYRDFVNGRANAILLDFNVDGVIYDKIDHGKEKLKWQS